MNKDLIDNYQLLSVSFDNETGLVSLVTGDLLACAPEGDLNTPSDIPCCTVIGVAMEEIYGDEVNWSTVIEHLQANYDWKNKNLP